MCIGSDPAATQGEVLMVSNCEGKSCTAECAPSSPEGGTEGGKEGGTKEGGGG
jgi:hypothetical protein